jgi:hypothetical protein
LVRGHGEVSIMANQRKLGVVVLALSLGSPLAGCTVISVEGDHNRIRDAGGHGGVALPEPDDAPTWRQRVERIEQALGMAHRGGQR